VAAFDLKMGTAFRMGPGFVPAMLGGALALVGLAIMAESLRGKSSEIGDIPWRGIVLITVGMVFLGLAMRPLGVLVSLSVAVFLSSFASRKTTLARAILVTVVLVAVTLGIFKYGLGRPMALFGPWLRFA
jgi:hypothetical protein